MSRRTLLALSFLSVGLIPGLARAQTVYDDGQNHNVTGASGPISVQNSGTTLTVESPAVVTASAGIQLGAAIVGGPGTAINMLGGQVVGSANPGNGPNGIDSLGSIAGF